jgi:hypothetical protein
MSNYTNYSNFDTQKNVAFAENKKRLSKKLILIAHDIYVGLVNFIGRMIDQVLGK